MNASVLIVDDEQGFRIMAEEALLAEGFDVRSAPTLARGRAEVERSPPDVVILDRRLPDGDGIDFLAALRTEGAAAPLVIVVTAYGDVENAVEALRAGAWDYLTKPIQLTDLVIKLRKVLEERGLRDRLAIARSSAAGPPIVEPRSRTMIEELERLRSVSQSPTTPVLIVGPSGVGKQYAAEALHTMTYAALDADAPFVEVNCAALPDDLVESELFGHEKGAFTDARSTRRGLIEMADGGTLFLDEVTELPPRSQAKLLKFLDTLRFRRLGGTRELAVQLRVIAATNQAIRREVDAGRFRVDLYHRLAVFEVRIPPLAERREDIPSLAEAFVQFFAARTRKRIFGISPDAMEALLGYEYAGQVRELRNIVERAVILARGATVEKGDIVLPASERAEPAGFFSVGLREDGSCLDLGAVERAYIGRVLEHLGGQRMVAAQALGISYPTFLKRLRELDLDG
jgi:two-component system, NtrC family, response regulator AtoC